MTNNAQSETRIVSSLLPYSEKDNFSKGLFSISSQPIFLSKREKRAMSENRLRVHKSISFTFRNVSDLAPLILLSL